ncbi:MAG: putative motility protein [Gammaproteobacteria bacterium]
MVNSISDANMPLMTTYAKQHTTQHDLQVSVMKKALDIQKIQGEAALKLIASVGSIAEQGVDVYV